MAEKFQVVLSLGTALASLAGMSSQGVEAKVVVANDARATAAQDGTVQPNAHYQFGEDLLGFVMTKHADGTIVAAHSSHSSHASHASHASSR